MTSRTDLDQIQLDNGWLVSFSQDFPSSPYPIQRFVEPAKGGDAHLLLC